MPPPNRALSPVLSRTQRSKNTEACNVLTRIPGRDPHAPPLVIMTPRSSWWTSTAERGGGIAAWLACVRHFAKDPGRCDVLFTANTGHELGHVGLAHYMARHPELANGSPRLDPPWRQLRGRRLPPWRDTRMAAGVRYQASPDLFAMGLETLEAFGVSPAIPSCRPASARVEKRRMSSMRAGATSRCWAKNPWFHHPDDRWPNTVDREKTETICRAVLHIARTLADA